MDFNETGAILKINTFSTGGQLKEIKKLLLDNLKRIYLYASPYKNRKIRKVCHYYIWKLALNGDILFERSVAHFNLFLELYSSDFYDKKIFFFLINLFIFVFLFFF